MKLTQHMSSLIAAIEGELAHFYDFPLHAFGAQHVINNEEIDELKKNHSGLEKLSPRGNVIAIKESREDLFVGLHLHTEIIDQLSEHNPLQKLSNENLDAYCVLVEELSHFHLLINRTHHERSVSQLELEFQGEIDKVLSSAIRLRAQSNDPQYSALARKIFDLSLSPSGTHSDHQLYWQATKYAAKTWFKIISYQDGIDDPLNSPNLQKILRPIYHHGWQEKFLILESSKAA